MPRDPENPIRTPSFRAKFAQVKGLSGDEKALFQRIGNLVDTLNQTQRQLTNPKGRRRKVELFVPIPENFQATVITGGMEVKWDSVAIPNLAFYEVQFSEGSNFADVNAFNVVGTQATYRESVPSGTLFARVRTVLKNGNSSEWTRTVSIQATVGSSIFSADFDHIDPENRSGVSPKPFLQTIPFNTEAGTRGFFGIGAHVGPSPLTFQDTNFNANLDQRNEITYTLYETDSPFPGLEQLRAPTIGEFIEDDPFYQFSPGFYMRFGTLPSSITDFFTVTNLIENPFVGEVEFLRYRIVDTFYGPNHPQAGLVFNASLSVIKL